MIKKLFILSISAVLILSTNAQAQSGIESPEKIDHRVTAFYTLSSGLGIDYELPITKNSSVLGRVSLNPIYAPDIANRIFDGTPHNEYGYSQLPIYFSGEYRYYINLNKRIQNGKSIANNSGNYMALRGRYNTDGLITKESEEPLTVRPHRQMASLGLVYGLQRSLSNKWGYSFNTGLFLMMPLQKGATIRQFFKNEYSNTAIWPGVDFGIHYKIK